MRLLILTAALLIATCNAKAQTISGNIISEKKEAVANATVGLLLAKDSSLIRSEISDQNGGFSFALTDTIPMLISVSAIGYQIQIKNVQQPLPVLITMTAAPKALNEITVTSKKPMIEVKPDKVIFNIENSVNAIGNTGFDLLRKSPGVMIDNNDNVSLLGNGVAIYIDNKPSPLTGKELSSFLRSLQSTDIEAIELIKNPSAKYDAAGTGGIINIRLKKNKNYGLNGNVNAGYGIGIYSKYNTGFSLNYRNKKINIFSNFSNNWGNNQSYINLYREQADSIYNQKSINTSRTSGQNVKAGIDYFINKKNTVGMLVSLFNDNWDERNNTATPILSIDTKVPSRTLVANNTAAGKKLNANFNINYHYADTSGYEWNTDADYGVFTTSNNNYQPNQYRTPDLQTILEEKNYNIVTNRDIHLFTLKSDYEQNVAGGRLGAGVKASFVTTDNGFDFFNVINRQNIIDSNRSNKFTLTENIYAAYISYQKKIKKWDIQAGIRAEQTNTTGTLAGNIAGNNQQVKRSYTNFFPSAGISYEVNNNNSLNINYSRRINRPGYQSLNPFESKLDELSYQKGNPFLKPEYTSSISLTHTYKYTLNTTVGYSRTTDFSTQITDTIEGKRNFIQQRNAGTQQNIYISISYPFNVTKWWSVYASVNGGRLINKVNLGPGRISNIAVSSYGVYNQHTITLPKKITLEVSGFYYSPSIWGGTFLNRAFWGVDAGLQKRLMKDKATIKISVSDIFKSMQWRGISNFSGLYMDASGGWESRQFKLSFTYRFGRKEIKSQRSRSTGSDEVNKRL
jgi:iron complex outermembrane recepter protein